MEKFREKALIEGGVDMNAAVAKYPSVKLTPLYRAVSNFNLLVIKTFIEAGVDVNARDEYGNTLLHGAASNSNSSMIMRLLKLGADPGARDNKGRTPFDCLGSGLITKR